MKAKGMDSIAVPKKRGGKRPGAGRKTELKAGGISCLYLEAGDIEEIKRFFPGVAISAFYRSAGRLALDQVKKKQLTLKFE